jgi:HEAT repeat protein
LEYPTSLPFLSDVADSTQSANVKAACNRSIAALAAGNAVPQTSTLYRVLSEAYYNEKSELTSFPGEEHQLLWDYNPAAGGLMMTAIRTPVFHEAMCMGLAERAMTLEAQGSGAPNPETLALWVSSNFSREIDTPKDYQNPAYPATRRPTEYYAMASGSDVAQRVLARGLDTRDTPLARRALVAVERTAGGKNLFQGGGRMPLLEALNYPSRRVQYEAALALASSQPQNAFAGSDRVVPVLASAIRGASSQYAVVISNDAETYQGVRRVLVAKGYTVLPQGRSIGELAQPIAEAPAVDLVVSVGLSGDRVPALIGEVRNHNKLAATPVLAMTNVESYNVLRHRYATDSGVAVRQVGLGEAQLNKTVDDLLTASTGGPVTAEEARAYAQRSLRSLSDLAISGNAVLNVEDATAPLIAAMGDQASPDRMDIARVLSHIGQDRAQRALIDAAMTTKDAERVTLLGMVTDSAKRFGNKLEVRSVAQVIELANSGSNEEATAAAALMGALSLPNNELLNMINQKK